MPKFHQELKYLSSQLSPVQLKVLTQETDVLHTTEIFTHTHAHTYQHPVYINLFSQINFLFPPLHIF